MYIYTYIYIHILWRAPDVGSSTSNTAGALASRIPSETRRLQ